MFSYTTKEVLDGPEFVTFGNHAVRRADIGHVVYDDTGMSAAVVYFRCEYPGGVSHISLKGEAADECAAYFGIIEEPSEDDA